LQLGVFAAIFSYSLIFGEIVGRSCVDCKKGKGRCHLDAALPGIVEDATTKLSGAVRLLLAQLKVELDQLVIRLEDRCSG